VIHVNKKLNKIYLIMIINGINIKIGIKSMFMRNKSCIIIGANSMFIKV